jgi:flavorubredoxin
MSIKIDEHIYSVGVDDRTTTLFESLWPVPDGISYNSYMLDDEKLVLFDTVKETKFGWFLENLREAAGDRAIDYLIVHHLEPDHCGSIEMLRKYYPEMKIIGNSKTVEFLGHIFPGLEGIEQVDDGQELAIGGHTLRFYKTPMIHWPETMMTYETKTGSLFSGDAFGAFGANNGAVYDYQNDLTFYEQNMLRYFSNIVGKYSNMVLKSLKKLSELDIKMICPTHGIVWKENPGWILDKYNTWSSQIGCAGVVVAYNSMYGNTERMIHKICGDFYENGLDAVKVYDVAASENSYIISDIWKYKGLVLAAPTYDTKIFPLMHNLLNQLGGKMLRNKFVGIIGTYGWSGGAVDGIKAFVEQCKLELVEPVVEARFRPKSQQLSECAELAANMTAKILQKPAEGE